MKADALLALVRRAFATPIPRTLIQPPTAKLVLVCLSLHADAQGQQAYPSRERLAALCEMSPRTVDRVLRDLCGVDLIREQHPPTGVRPRTWQLAVDNLWITAPRARSGDHSCPTDLLPFDLLPSQIDRTPIHSCQPVSHRFATDQEQIQIQEQELREERAPANAGDANYRVIVKLAHTVLDLVGAQPSSLGDVVEAVKERCAKSGIVYWPGNVVQRAVAAAFVQRVGRPADPIAIHHLRALERRRS